MSTDKKECGCAETLTISKQAKCGRMQMAVLDFGFLEMPVGIPQIIAEYADGKCVGKCFVCAECMHDADKTVYLKRAPTTWWWSDDSVNPITCFNCYMIIVRWVLMKGGFRNLRDADFWTFGNSYVARVGSSFGVEKRVVYQSYYETKNKEKFQYDVGGEKVFNCLPGSLRVVSEGDLTAGWETILRLRREHGSSVTYEVYGDDEHLERRIALL